MRPDRNRTSLGMYCAVLAALAVLSTLSASGPAVGQQQIITVSEETTHVVEPLDEEGFVDFVAAVNRRQRLAPHMNSMALYAQAFGSPPGAVGVEFRPRFLAMLGVPPQAANGELFVPVAGPRRDLAAAQAAPWTSGEFPGIAAWLEANDRPLATVRAGSLRSGYYMPHVRLREDELALHGVERLLSYAQAARELSHALWARAMRRAGEDDIEGAVDDLLTALRLGRHVGHGATLVHLFVGCAVEGNASHGLVRLAHGVELTREQAREVLRQLESLPPRASTAAHFNERERLMLLDLAQAIARRGPSTLLDRFGDVENIGHLADLLTRMVAAGTDEPGSADWDEALRALNGRYDEMVAACSQATYAAVVAELEQLDERVGAMHDEPDRSADELRRERSRRLGTELVRWALPIATVQGAVRTEQRAAAMLELAKAAIALSAYHHERGEYPERLDQLVPEYLQESPQDPFADAPLRYRRDGDGYVVWSVGPDQVDDGGRPIDHEQRGDLVVRTPNGE